MLTCQYITMMFTIDREDWDLLDLPHWIDNAGYVNVQATPKLQIRLHKLIAERMGLKGQVDHIDANKLNNSRSNLRLCTHAQNQHNTKLCSSNTSGFKGVTWDKVNKKWMAKIKVHGKFYNLGRFTDKSEAAKAYDAKARELQGSYARLNFPLPGEQSAI